MANSTVGVLRELWLFMRERKKWWLLPILVVMLLVGSLLVFAQGSALAPFILRTTMPSSESTPCLSKLATSSSTSLNKGSGAAITNELLRASTPSAIFAISLFASWFWPPRPPPRIARKISSGDG